ncbi:hypothetical protein MCAP1_001494 [Malassezia caprae]|uniref:Phosphoglycerate mutase-like protein n=1 Tax=Malassezia caprae TaxID=1381934 RepID=A0AAF0E6Q3_9BASI|nr:hypothetical protein MCAP1_001494 [Malassezia caprae]
MAPTSRIYLTRHAQAEHVRDSNIADALLTKLGEQQAARLPSLTPELQDVAEVIISSPLRRTLQSASLGYADAIKRLGGDGKIVCLPQAQECNDVPCDTGSLREVLETQPYFAKYDFSLLTPDWTSKQGFYAAHSESLDARAQWVRQYLRERPEQHIVLVAHGDFLRRLTKEPESYWANAEVRLFQFEPTSVHTDACPLTHIANVAEGDWTDATAPEPVPTTQAALSSMEQRVKQMQASLASQTDVLADLDRRLEAAERKKAELESHDQL